jgi:spermidine synthase
VKDSRAAGTALGVGFLALGIEIVAGRLLAPFFGSSLYQWAALIGVVLLGYVLGYAAHEKLTRFGPAAPLAAGGIYVLALPLWLFPAVELLLSLPMWLAAILAAALSVGIPSFAWASILPWLQRRAGDRGYARMLAWSAVGNLVGAWGVAFLAVPHLGTRLSLLLHGVLALALALAWIRGGLRSGRVVLAMLALAGGLLAALQAGNRDLSAEPWKLLRGSPAADLDGSGPRVERKLVHTRDSAYQTISVWDETRESADGPKTRRALSFNGSLQFLWSEHEKLTEGERYEYYNFATAAAGWTRAGAARSALVLGLGGGLIPWQIHQQFPSTRITAFELDPAVAETARAYLPLSRVEGVELAIGDARTLLSRESRTFDYILVDVFLNSYVPFHLTTLEFFKTARERLSPGGVLVANFHTIFSTSGLLPKLEATIQKAFPSVAAFELPAGTTLVVASADFDVLSDRLRAAIPKLSPELGALTSRALASLRGPATEEAGTGILTDDLNDTEQRLYETRKYILVSRPI